MAGRPQRPADVPESVRTAPGAVDQHEGRHASAALVPDQRRLADFSASVSHS